MNPRLLLVGALLLSACESSKWAAGLPQRDPALAKSTADFAKDAAHRVYPADAPREKTDELRAQVGYGLKTVEIANLSDKPWKNSEVWLNQKYVIFVPEFHKGEVERLWFRGIYDNQGHHFPTSNTLIDKIEVYHDGVLYELPVHLSD